MKKFSKSLSLFLAIIMVLTLIAPVLPVLAEETKTITILGTSDMHGRIFPWEYAIASPDDDAGYALIQTLVKQEKEKNPNAILVDNGDTLQDNMAEIFNNDPVHPMIQVMNYMGYDTWTLGNHEFNFGMDFLNKNITAFKGAALAANIYKEDGTRFVNGYKIIEKDGVRVAIVGMVAPHIPRWEASTPEHFKGLTFTDPVEEAKKVVKELEGKYDVLIGTFHMGDKPEYSTTDGALPIAEACPEFDAILTGHAHSQYDNVVSKSGVKLIEPGRYGAALAKIDVKLVKDGDNWKVAEVDTKNLSTKKLAADEALTKQFKSVDDRALAEGEKVVGEITEDFIKDVDFITGKAKVTTMPTSQLFDNAVIDFINEVQKHYAKADVSSAALFTNDSNLKKGPFKKKDVAFIYKYDNTLVGINITGKNLKTYMEWSASYYNTAKPGDVTLSFNQDIRGYNYDMFSGVDYQIDVTKPAGSRIINATIKGQPIDDNKIYKLAINNYRYGTLEKELKIATTADRYYDSFAELGDAGRVRDLIVKYVQENKGGKIAPSVDNNWKVVGMDLNNQYVKAVKMLVGAGALSIPTSEDGRTPNVKALNVNDLLKEGKLTAPYKVKAGDMLWKIAAKFGFKWQEVAEYNNMKDVKHIYPGQEIYIPYKEIDVLSTNDFHGSLEGGSEAGAAKVAAYMDFYKAENPNGTVIVDAGDAFQGTPLSNIHRGLPVVEMMDMIGYDAMAIGNHEFDWGIEAALKSLKKSEIEVLAANIYEKGKAVNWAKPYTIINKDGVKIGIIGLSTPETSITAHANYVGKYEFKSPIEVANALIPIVKAKGADIIVILGHLPGTQDSKTKEVTGELADVAKAVKGADVIIGGHSHNSVAAVINNAAVIEANKNGRNIGHATVLFDPVNKKVVATAAEYIEVRKGALDVKPVAEVQAMVDKYNEELKPVFDQVIGKTSVALVRDYNNESNIGNWMADAMREKAGTQIAFTNAGGIRTDIDAGEVTVGEIFTVMPFDNTIVVGNMTGTQIKAMLEQSVTLFKGMMQVSGLKVTYDSSKPEGQRIVSMSLADGTPIDMSKTYTAATSDFLAPGQDGFVTLKETKFTDMYTLIRDALIENIKKNGTIAPAVDGRMIDVKSKTSVFIQNLPLAA